jgi:DNA-binding NarL/FixJ family response regulator
MTGEEVPVMPDADPACEPTRAELAVLILVADGWSTDEIATALGITPKAVYSRLQQLQRRCGCRNRPALLTLAFRRGWVDDGTRSG